MIDYDYNTILENLRLYDDEPDYSSKLFGFDEYKEQMIKVIGNVLEIDKPFAICLNGEWGSGKTSLMRRVYEEFEQRSKDDDKLKVIWFDAWKYERLDPVLALLQTIIYTYITKSDKLKKFFSGLFSLTADISSRNVLGLTAEEVKKHFKNTVKKIDMLDEIIEETIGDGNLLVFIDDLDRCHIDNIIGMLEAIKILFNAKNAKFIVAVDIKKLERAWALKHNNDASAIEEGKDHLDKIFQLKLNLPRKSDEDITAYIDKIVERFPKDLRDIVRTGCKANPRKIKRLMNVLYVTLLNLDDKDKDNNRFNEIFPAIVILSISVTTFPKLIELIMTGPSYFIEILHKIRYEEDNLLSFIKILTGGHPRINAIRDSIDLYSFKFLKEIIKYIEYEIYCMISMWPEEDLAPDTVHKLASLDQIIETRESITDILDDIKESNIMDDSTIKEAFNEYRNRSIKSLIDNLQYIISNTKLFL